MRKVKIFLMLMPLILILLAGMVYAANTCIIEQDTTDIGTSNTHIRGDQNISATLTVGDPNINATTASLTCNGCIETIEGVLDYNESSSLNGTYFNMTLNTINLADNTTYTLNVTIKNGSNQLPIASCIKTFIPDNTIPVITSQSPSTGTIDLDGTVDFSAVAVNISSSAVLGKLYLSGTSYTMSRSSGNTFALTKKMEPGNYEWYTTFTDGLNTTTDSVRTISISSDASGGSGGGATFIATTKDKKKTKEQLSALGITSEKVKENIANAKARAKKEVTQPKELGKTAGATVAGAIVGSIIPGVGTVIGGVVGFIVGIIW